jgi:hypothetical protein
MVNTNKAKNAFLSDNNLKERYRLSLLSQAQDGSILIDNDLMFQAAVQPSLTSHKKVIIYALKSALGDIARINNGVSSRLAGLAMIEAISGSEPRIAIEIDSDGNLIEITDAQIDAAVNSQFTDDKLIESLIRQNFISVVVNQ